MPQISFSRVIILAGVLLVLFLGQLGSARLWDRDEPRNSRASHEMLQRNDWIVPTFNGELRDHKPILLYWGQMISYSLLGESEFSARLPSALCAMLTCLAVAILGTRLSGGRGINQEGFWAGVVMGTSLLFIMAGRAATPDAMLIAFSTLGIASLVIAAIEPSVPYRSGRVGKARWIPALFGYTMLGLAVLAKGPVGLILPLAVVHLWWMVCHRLQQTDGIEASGTSGWSARGLVMAWQCFNPVQFLRSVWALRAIPGVIVCLIAAAPWYVAVGLETNGDFLRGFFLDHNLGRAVNSMEGHHGSVFYYPMAFLAGTFPWSLWLIPILIWAKHSQRTSVVHRQMIVLAGCWIGVYVGAFSLASTKLPSYITPCYVGAALVVGNYLRDFEMKFSLPSQVWRKIAYSVTCLVGLAISVAIYWLSEREQMPLLNAVSLGGFVLLAVGVAGFVLDATRRVEWVPAAWLGGAVGFHFLLFAVGAPSVDSYRKDLALLEQLQADEPEVQWIAVGGLEPSWVHYLDQTIEEVKTSPVDEQSWKQVEEFLKQHPQGNLILAGDQAIEAASQYLGAELVLERIAEGPRFLKSGSLVVCKPVRKPTPENGPAEYRSAAEAESSLRQVQR